MRRARSRSFSFRGCTFTIRLPYTYPSLIIEAVVIMFSASFVAVPAFIRVDPVTISGPIISSIAISAACGQLRTRRRRRSRLSAPPFPARRERRPST